MMCLASKLIDTDALFKVIWVSFLAAVGGTAAFSLAILGATRFVDFRRDGRRLESSMFALVAGVGIAICLGGIALGLYEIIKK
jgi:hypothetical protein